MLKVWTCAKIVGTATVAAVAIYVLAFFGFALGTAYGPNSDVHKFLMPGRYELSLPKGSYQAWTYTTWRSKQVEVPLNSPLPVQIIGPDGAMVRQETSDVHHVDETDFKGSMTALFEAKESGTYQVSAVTDKRFVFVIVNADKMYVNLGSNFVYPGQFGDFNFEEPIKRAHEQ